jgi:transcriptional regulator with XRE-family HTH domain
LTQEGLAERAHLSAKFVGLVERAVGNPTLDVLIRIASALEIEIAELFRFEEAEERSERASHDAGLVAERMSRYLVGRSAREVGRVVRIVEAALDLPPARRRRSKH